MTVQLKAATEAAVRLKAAQAKARSDKKTEKQKRQRSSEAQAGRVNL